MHWFAIGSPDLLNGTRAGGLFLLPAAPLLAYGCIEVARQADRRLFLIAGLLIGMAPAVLNSTPASVQRELAALPFAAAIAAIGWQRLPHVTARYTRLATALGAAAAIALFGFFLHDYFGDYRERSAGRYDPLNIKAVHAAVARADGDRPAPQILLTIGDHDLGAGASAEAYWSFYSLVGGNPALDSKTRVIALETIERQMLEPDTLIVTNRSGPILQNGGAQVVASVAAASVTVSIARVSQ